MDWAQAIWVQMQMLDWVPNYFGIYYAKKEEDLDSEGTHYIEKLSDFLQTKDYHMRDKVVDVTHQASSTALRGELINDTLHSPK